MVLDLLLGWLLFLPPMVAIITISFIVSFIITIAVKFLSNQTLIKELKSEMKELQKQMKEAKSNPKKMSKINSQFMETNMKYMSNSMRPTLFTFIPIILVFGWLNSHIAYLPLTPNEPFELVAKFEDHVDGTVTLNVPQGLAVVDGNEKEILLNEANFVLRGELGEYEVELEFKDAKYTKDVLITNEKAYAPVSQNFRSGFLFFQKAGENGINSIDLGNQRIKPFADIPVLNQVPIIANRGWLAAYFVFSILFSLLLRRVLKVYM